MIDEILNDFIVVESFESFEELRMASCTRSLSPILPVIFVIVVKTGTPKISVVWRAA